jgi:uncharacterized RDD family membrane protein YckC
MVYVGLGKRFVALLIDSILLQAVNILLASVFGTTAVTEGGASFALQGPAALLGILISFVYYIGLEGLRGATLGKQVVGIKVVNEDGSPIDWTAAILRNVLRIVDALPCFYIVGIVLINNSEQKQRFGDRIAKTVVVEKNSV